MPAKNDACRYPARGARSALALLLLINLFNYIDRQVLASVVGPIKQTFFGHSGGPDLMGSNALTAAINWSQHALGFKPEDALLGLLGTAFMLIYMVTAPIFARFAEQKSRWMIVGAGILMWSLATGASGIAGTFFALLFTRCFVGIGEAAYGPVAPDMISDLYPIKDRGRVLAWFYAATPVGGALGYVLGGLIAHSNIGNWGSHWFGMQGDSWRWAFYIVTIPGIILAIKSLYMQDPPRERALSSAKSSTPWREYLILLRTPSFTLCTLGMTAMTFALGGIAFWMPYYLEGKPGAPSHSTIMFGAVSAVAGLAATLAGGIVGDKLRDRFSGSYFLVSGGAMILGFPIFLLMLRSSFPWMIWVLLFLACFCLFFNTGPTNTILANVSHPSMRAAAFALNIFFIHALGDVISPVIIGILNDRYRDMNKSFMIVAFMFLIAGIFWLIGAQYLRRDTEKANASGR